MEGAFERTAAGIRNCQKAGVRVGLRLTLTGQNVQDLEDLRLQNDAALSTKLNGKMSFKVSHNLLFDNVPVDGFRKIDHTTMITLVASIL